MAVGAPKRVVVVGLGMVGISFIEKLLKLDARTREYTITVVGEEPHLAYNRVGLTTFFEHRKVENLYLNPLEWYQSIPPGLLTWHINTRVLSIHPSSKHILCSNGQQIPYDILVLATGSSAAPPPDTLPGRDAEGVFVYRTIDDLEKLMAYSSARQQHRGTVNGAVVGGGLLGLEAAKALKDLGCYDRVSVVERNGWLLSRQIDETGGGMVVEKVRELGVDVVLRSNVEEIEVDTEGRVKGLRFREGGQIECETVCFAIGIRPRDELARQAGIRCAERGGGIVVDEELRTSCEDVYAIGECASWDGQVFGLIAPGVEMAEVLAWNLTQARLHQPRGFKQPDLSTKLKLLGVDVASFGDYFADVQGPKKVMPPKGRRGAKVNGNSNGVNGNGVNGVNGVNGANGTNGVNGNGVNGTNGDASSPQQQQVKTLTYKDPFQGVYKKYIFTPDGKYLLGGIMVGDTRDYVKLVPLVKNRKQLEIPPAELILGAAAKKDGDDGDDLDDDTQICSCHNVTKGDVVKSVKDGGCQSLNAVKACTKAGTGCGGCVPLVTSIFNSAMKAMGNEVANHLCSHFRRSRAELYHIIMVKRLQTFADVMREAGVDGESGGCEVCKPCVGSILSSLWNRHVMDASTHGLQDTNDRFLANIQRDGTYSVVPRVPAGEITPDKLLAIARVAKEYNLYTKITGGQRIDMFGARKQDLIDIWRKLVDAGMESGHAYAKALRTVKSCVGSTWCRYGVGDSVGLAVRLEERYKSIRAPHKIKGGVSGCVRECAEAQSKDFGLIATDKGFNIYVAGNGGAKPKHAELLAKDVPPTEVIPILDRYLMFYIRTADKLQRTARWLESLPGGIAYLRSVVLDDSLGINAALEQQMQELVDSYFDEWAEAVRRPEIADKFRQFANTDEAVEGVELETDREQLRPAFWPKDGAPSSASSEPKPDEENTNRDFAALTTRWQQTQTPQQWHPLLPASYFAGADALPNGISAAVKHGDTQLAIWRFKGRYYASQQMCPHKRAFVLSDGLVGEAPCTSTSNGTNGADSGKDDNKNEPYISCPHHKRNFSLLSGACLSDPSSGMSIATFPVEERLHNGEPYVYVLLPSTSELDAALGTRRWRVKKGEAGVGQMEEVDLKVGFAGRKGKKNGVVRKIGKGVNGNGNGVNGVNGVKNGVNGDAGVEVVKVVKDGWVGGCGLAVEW